MAGAVVEVVIILTCRDLALRQGEPTHNNRDDKTIRHHRGLFGAYWGLFGAKAPLDTLLGKMVYLFCQAVDR